MATPIGALDSLASVHGAVGVIPDPWLLWKQVRYHVLSWYDFDGLGLRFGDGSTWRPKLLASTSTMFIALMALLGNRQVRHTLSQ